LGTRMSFSLHTNHDRSESDPVKGVNNLDHFAAEPFAQRNKLVTQPSQPIDRRTLMGVLLAPPGMSGPGLPSRKP
jgi:hypothetical protein